MADAPARRLRVVYALDTFETGGTELNAVRTAERLDRSRFDVRFVCLGERGPLVSRVRDAGFRIDEFRIGSLVSGSALQQGNRLRRWLRDERIDVFHAHDIYSNIWGVPWARVAGVPLVIASRRWWTETNRPAHARLNRWSYSIAHRVLANSPSVARLVEEEGLAPERVVIIPNFVSDDAFIPPSPGFLDSTRLDLQLEPDDEVVGVIANFHAIKDLPTMLRALARLSPARPRLRLVLVGDGTERGALVQQVESLGLADRVRFAGRRAPMPSLHWLFDVSVLCSRGEGFPNSLVEAMAAARPVVATSVGGIPDAVIDGETGVLIDAGDDHALAAAVGAMLDDPGRREALGRAGAARARGEFAEVRVITKLETVYRQLANSAV